MSPTFKSEIIDLLSLNDTPSINLLLQNAYQVKNSVLGKTVFLRGLIEFSNICVKECYYCGIRKSNSKVDRYLMSEEEILNSAMWAFENGYGSIVLQSGERNDKKFVSFVENILLKISEATSNKLRITLSCGEQSKETYKRWFEAGARRFLLRIESSNKIIYENIHPSDHNFNRRVKCLLTLKEIGYQLGTGVMIGLPNQTIEDLANDIIFFRSLDADMIGMGPFIPHADTPLFEQDIKIVGNKNELYNLSLKMVAVTRIMLPKINIAAATAFQALYPFGREKALLAGANVFMPNISEVKYRKDYRLYETKPCVDENSIDCLQCVEKRIEGIGESIAYFEWGDSQHFEERIYNN
ncbi:MAG: [FeFe] hydrogenase H-cluster radical SAM maturase HydE [Bacteroidetes bacterium]|nr:[FeFe] hydrogenase H-cluster radical SAM maturase HydE [Bacteroidota bacterium]